MVDPSDLHRDVMWGCFNWTWEPWSDLGIGVEYGRKIRFHIRPGIYWHDGTPYTAEDAAFSYDLLKNLQLQQYASVAQTYVYSDIVDIYTIDVYINCTGLWCVYDYARSAMIFNEAVWKPLWDDPAGAEAFTPWNITYDEWTGQSGHGDLTCLVGTGPYMFLSWDREAGVCHLTANRPGAVWAGNPGYWAGHFLREDLNFNGIIDIFDAVMLANAAGTVPGDSRWNYGIADINGDYIVDLFDAVLLSDHAGWITLPA